MSLNYYAMTKRTITQQYAYVPSAILSPTGVATYQSGANPLFRIFCGDKLITDYDEGGLLVMTLQLHFKDSLQKQQVQKSFSGGYGSLANLTNTLKTLNQQYNLAVTVRVRAFQIGGEPSKLSGIVNPAAPAVDITNIDYYAGTIKSLDDYAAKSFGTQFTSDSSYVPIGKVKKGIPISSLGLIVAPTYLTPETLAVQDELSRLESQQAFNKKALERVANDYPVQLEANYQQQVNKTLTTTKNNLNLIHENGELCFKYPYLCNYALEEVMNGYKDIEDKKLLLSNLTTISATSSDGINLSQISLYPTSLYRNMNNSYKLELSLDKSRVNTNTNYYWLSAQMIVENGYTDVGADVPSFSGIAYDRAYAAGNKFNISFGIRQYSSMCLGSGQIRFPFDYNNPSSNSEIYFWRLYCSANPTLLYRWSNGTVKQSNDITLGNASNPFRTFLY